MRRNAFAALLLLSVMGCQAAPATGSLPPPSVVPSPTADASSVQVQLEAARAAAEAEGARVAAESKAAADAVTRAAQDAADQRAAAKVAADAAAAAAKAAAAAARPPDWTRAHCGAASTSPAEYVRHCAGYGSPQRVNR